METISSDFLMRPRTRKRRVNSIVSWFVRRRGSPEEERLRDLQRRFRAVGARHDRAKKRFYRLGTVAMLAAIGGFALCWGLLSLSPWPPMTTLKHIASFPNCDAARALGLTPSKRGQPGYWKRHDRDGDGIACERRQPSW
jgi:hypothetical protein